jgi:hypothetical protein
MPASARMVPSTYVPYFTAVATAAAALVGRRGKRLTATPSDVECEAQYAA